MADEYGAVRSNEFRVKDFDAFKAWTDTYRWTREGEVIVDQTVGGQAMIAFHDQYPSILPVIPPDDAEDDDEPATVDPACFAKEFAEHLEPGETAVLMSVGNTKLVYVRASWIVIRSDGSWALDFVESGDAAEDFERLASVAQQSGAAQL